VAGRNLVDLLNSAIDSKVPHWDQLSSLLVPPVASTED